MKSEGGDMNGAFVIPVGGQEERVPMECGNCAYSEPEYGHLLSWLECRRNAPNLGPTVNGLTSRWPHVNANEHCGQYQGDTDKVDQYARRLADTRRNREQQASSRDDPTWQKDSQKTS